MVIMSRRHPGFTIVELIVVIVVIALLATISVFSIGTWRQRTATTEVREALITLASALKSEVNFANTYPTTQPANYKPSSTVTIAYTSNGAVYCASGTSTAVPTVKMYITNTNPEPSTTACT